MKLSLPTKRSQLVEGPSEVHGLSHNWFNVHQYGHQPIKKGTFPPIFEARIAFSAICYGGQM